MLRANAYLIPAEEVRSLLKYAAESAIVISEDISNPLNSYIELSSGISEKSQNESLEPKNSDVDNAVNNTSFFPSPEKVTQSYTLLCQLTKPVTGSTLIDSCKYRSMRYSSPIRWTCALFLLLALANLILEIQFANEPMATDTEQDWLQLIQVYFLSPLAPFFWGGLGSCVFLIKKFSDLSADRVFNYNYYGGWKSRVLLGTVLGGIIPYLFTIKLKDESLIDDYTIAFLVGLAVKVVYGALEKTVDEVAQKLNLHSSYRTPTPLIKEPQETKKDS
ncbi:hypothetical protein [Alteromonas macleodii]|uniref:hypothetical protein n=1 Tax=Alteromonas macleodii TaxID=28108 RepID=UPI0020766D9F|nr:hypothetical protein [Alteromonas macleodii]USI27907.1 hypothetical protein NFG60_19720 [Alteromonas macleodii]